jgi:hypothetical protein
MRIRTMVLSLTALATTSSVLASPGSAQATNGPHGGIRGVTVSTAYTGGQAEESAPAAGWARCPHGYFCIFDGFNGTGSMAWFQFGSPDLRGQGMNNRTSSFWNRQDTNWSLYDGFSYHGQCFSVFGSRRGNLSTWNNRVGSLRRPGGECA